MRGTWVQALVRKDPTCRGTTKQVRHNYWAGALEPASHNYRACMLQLPKPVSLEPVLHNKRSHSNDKPATKSRPCSPQLEKACVQQRRPNATKNKFKKINLKKKKAILVGSSLCLISFLKALMTPPFCLPHLKQSGRRGEILNTCKQTPSANKAESNNLSLWKYEPTRFSRSFPF